MDPITREEMYLAAAAGYDVEPPEPITRKEVFLAKLAGMDVETPAPFTRRERFIEEAAVASNKAVIEPLQITENGAYTAPAGVDGYNPVTVNVDPTKVTILREQEISGFAPNSSYGGLYTKHFNFGSEMDAFEIVKGEEYLVHWDGEPYTVIAMDASAVLPGAVFLGNGALMGLGGNGEPFAIGATQLGATFFGLTDPASTHSVGIWQKITQEIKLQDKTITENGEYAADSGFDGLGKVTVDVAGSGGGNLPTGVYLEQIQPLVPNNQSAYYYSLNDELYAINKSIYKLVNGAWVSVVSGHEFYADAGLGVVLNGKIHLLGYYHEVFDGSAITRMNNTGIDNPQGCFAYENKLYLAKDSTGYWEWNETDDSWIKTGITYTGVPVIYKGEPYSLYNGKLYKIDFDNKTTVQVDTIDLNGFYAKCVSAFNGKIILSKGNPSTLINTVLYFYDLESNTLSNGMPLPVLTYLKFYQHNREDRLFGVTTTPYKLHCKMHYINPYG